MFAGIAVWVVEVGLAGKLRQTYVSGLNVEQRRVDRPQMSPMRVTASRSPGLSGSPWTYVRSASGCR